MSARTILSAAVVAMSVVGVVFVSVPFIRSFEGSSLAGERLPTINLVELEPGTFRWLNSVYRERGVPDILVIRDTNGEIHAFELPVMDGKYLMPDVEWNRWGGLCREFGPDSVDGRLESEGIIRCHDSEVSEGWAKEWRWSYAGENLGEWTSDLRRVEFVREGSTLRIGG